MMNQPQNVHTKGNGSVLWCFLYNVTTARKKICRYHFANGGVGGGCGNIWVSKFVPSMQWKCSQNT